MKNLKLKHFYQNSALYSIMARRNIAAYAAEAYPIAVLSKYWFFGSKRKADFKPSVLEMFSGHKSSYKDMLLGSFPFEVSGYDMLDILEHPDSKKNGVTIGNALTYDFGHKFDLIIQPWDNLVCLVTEDSMVPTRESIVTLFKNVARHMHKDSGFIVKLGCTLEDYLDSDSPLGEEDEVILSLEPGNDLMLNLGFGNNAGLLTYTHLTEFDRMTQTVSGTVSKMVVTDLVTSKKCKIDIEEPNILRFFSEAEIYDCLKEAGLDFEPYLQDSEGLLYQDFNTIQPAEYVIAKLAK